MDSPQGSMPRYRPLLVDANQMSYQNTVVVRNPDGSWWLGYIQDMDGDRAFIHFDSTKANARWIHMGSVWPLPFYDEEPEENGSENVPAYVALRDEDDGPLRFRATVLLGHLTSCNNCDMFCIKSAAPISSVQATAASVEVVEMGQVAFCLPPSDPPLLERRSGIIYSKYFIPFARASSALRDASDKFRIIKHFRNAFDSNDGLLDLTDRCRFHLRIERDGCMFITINVAQQRWDPPGITAPALLQVLDTHLASRDTLPAIGCGQFRASEDISCADGWENDAMQSAAHIGQLTPWLMSGVLAHLDLQSQMTAKRVCALWQLLLSSAQMTLHISINMENCYRLQEHSNHCFKLAALLCRSIHSTTISLTFLNVFPPLYGLFIRPLLKIMKIRLPLIVFKGQIVSGDVTMAGQREHRLKHPATYVPTECKHVCEVVALYNWKVSRLFGLPTFRLFRYLNFQGVLRCLPEHELRFMKDLTWESHELAIDKLEIRIPRLLLRCSDGRMHMASRFMCAVNDCFPPVTAEMLAKVAAVHARWVVTLAYPEEWQPVRNYLLVFSGFHADGSPRSWEDIDLRAVDVSTLSKLAIYGINEVFAV
ncbi:uncharacterized protein LOC129587925 [Paramacrobiotus metropolitanus]|uniref:uncharacterized protein LOC129587925 n=1 Tax=Paramacrobiotus metropolitanus TaxID=2943436 RepID=UPI0024459E29|nr:uncharacterized protein LOC129587925 [Paramacrobiotus metropolitanus]XP_055337869.1 uncharacterized protein LOC129587925 [Paramacrobiotus metropolitanus]XP_055337870.1 uncharacterized protein LOC129587925 [Paramacrobiotus metropolitanus]XP_055337871.1 uncharacterized protein LOC129587925 [Paramacrobiotus metropolitanus]XP_055337873.1 uncharacterized protein LOC129587925 [Paramacrobiotus metropolitanus]XP_055337874.1 uncharacterized protein LOC129587925 [Paramacrobiotus metropolitanus]